MDKEVQIRKDREFTPYQRLWFNRGCQIGEDDAKRKYQKKIGDLIIENNTLKAGNKQLAAEVHHLDRAQPLAGIFVTRNNAKLIIKALKRPTVSKWHADGLQKKLDSPRKESIEVIGLEIKSGK
jgi:hypothetical protein